MYQNSLPGVPEVLAGCESLAALSLAQQETAAAGAAEADLAVLRSLPCLRLLVVSAGHYGHSSHMAVGLRSPAEASHLARVRGALPPGMRVTNSQAELERACGRLQALFEVNVRAK